MSAQSDTQLVRPAVIIGGNRIPFARSNGAYSKASNQDMLTAAIDGLVARFGLQGQRLGAVAGGAVLKHSKDFNLVRECVLGTSLSPETPAYDVQMACATGMEAIGSLANKIKLGQIDSAIGGGVDTTSDAPIAVSEGLRSMLLDLSRARTTGAKLKAMSKFRPSFLAPNAPGTGEPRTGLSMGNHQALTTKAWDISREAQDELALASHKNLAAAYDRNFFDDLITPFAGVSRDTNLRADSTLEKLASLKPAFGKNLGDAATMTAGNSTPLTDGASVVLLGSEDYARANDLPMLANFVDFEAAAVDFVHGAEGLLMAPGLRGGPFAQAQQPHPAGLRLLRDPRGLRRNRARHARGLGGCGILQEQARPGRAAGLHRPQQAQRQRLLAGRRPPVCRHRRAHRGHAGEDAP